MSWFADTCLLITRFIVNFIISNINLNNQSHHFINIFIFNYNKPIKEEIITMSAKRKASPKKATHPSYKAMVLEAIASKKYARSGVSRAAIANYIQSNYNLEAGARFNSSLRAALGSGMTAGILVHGDTAQRYKLTDAGKQEIKDANKQKKSKKKKTPKKKKKTPKKKTSKKKKKVTKKKKVSKKKKTTSKKKKPASKKRASPKKKRSPKKK
eukprot:708383_1